MKQIVYLGLALMMAASLLTACDKFGQNEYKASEKNALVIKPALRTKADNGIQREDGSYVYLIKEMSYGGSATFPEIGPTFRCHFYQEETITQLPDLGKAIFSISGITPYEEEETIPGQFINVITFFVPDYEALGMNTNHFDIWMKDGKYRGDNPYVKDVKIKSFKYSPDPKETNINIVITTKEGDEITLRYVNGVCVWDGRI